MDEIAPRTLKDMILIRDLSNRFCIIARADWPILEGQLLREGGRYVHFPNQFVLRNEERILGIGMYFDAPNVDVVRATLEAFDQSVDIYFPTRDLPLAIVGRNYVGLIAPTLVMDDEEFPLFRLIKERED
jgi:hypothetical protein